MRIDVCIQSGKSSGEEERLKYITPQDSLARVLGFGSSVPERTSSPRSHGQGWNEFISRPTGLFYRPW
jgi:hypothetical protein